MPILVRVACSAPAARRRGRVPSAWVRPVLLALAVANAAYAQPVAAPDSLFPPAGRHPLGVRDLWSLERISDLQPSPDGRAVAYVSKSYDPATNAGASSLWLVATAGGPPRRLTTADANDANPRWSPDGRRLGFTSDRSGTEQIWVLDLQGGEPRQLTHLPVGVESFAWSPDGRRLAFAAEVYADCATLECTQARRQELEGDGVGARRYDHLLFRHWDAWDSGRRKHLLVVPADGGTPVDLLRGADLDAPPAPFGDAESYAWSPDGSQIAFQGRRRGGSMSWVTGLDVYLAATDGTGFRCITAQNLAADASPRWSPDGRTLAYLAMARPGYEADRQRIVLYDVQRGTRRVLTEAWDRSPSELVWSVTGKTLYASVQDRARRQLYAVDATNGTPRQLGHPGSATSLRVTAGRADGRIVFLGESLTAPADVYTCANDGTDLRRLTDANARALGAVRMSRPEELWLDGAGGAKVHAWLHPPVDRQEGVRYPLVLLLHGGPQGSWDDRWSYRWNPQVFAAAGFAVLAPDPHGSNGYGQAFTDAINGDWGGKAYEDVVQAVDQVAKSVLWVDGSRVAAAGGSFGGYMVFWIAGHTSRFRCLVSHAGLFDLASFYATTEEQWFPEWEFLGTPWENPESYARWSPSAFVKNWKTPTLVTTGGRDYRVPESQSFAAFTALQRLGVPSELLWFAGENHLVLQPRDSILWYDAVLGWLGRWLAPEAPAAPRTSP